MTPTARPMLSIRSRGKDPFRPDQPSDLEQKGIEGGEENPAQKPQKQPAGA